MILPFNRKSLEARNLLDDAQMVEEAAASTPAQRVERAFALSAMVRELAHASGAARLADEHADLAEKSRLYAAPLRAVDRHR